MGISKAAFFNFHSKRKIWDFFQCWNDGLEDFMIDCGEFGVYRVNEM